MPSVNAGGRVRAWTVRGMAVVAPLVLVAMAGCSSSPGSTDPCSPVAGADLLSGTPCDPVTQPCAAPFLGCYFQAPVGSCAFECFMTYGPGVPDGATCMYLNDCEPGLACVEASLLADCTGPSCCSPFCGVSTGGCATGEHCALWAIPAPVPPGLENVGACVTDGR